jgi:exodeoxyribonuclease V
VITVDFSLDQQAVLDAVLEWRAQNPCGDNQYLTLGGYAGTGKSTLVSYLGEMWDNVAIATLCGKAAHVLRLKGADAQTIHSLLYVPFKGANGRPNFRKRQTLNGTRTLIIDEASMIDHLLFADILSFRLPTLFVGDHGQLEPIGTNPRLMANPKLRLEKIHRQAMDNPILRLAAAFREGKPVRHWQDPQDRLRIVSRSEFDRLISPEVQMICGFNETRHKINASIRQMMGLDRQGTVAPGEKLICLRNNRVWNIFNGQQVTVLDIAYEGRNTIDLEVETDDGRCFMLPCLRRQFGHNPIEGFRSKEVAQMDYGYCLTAHKAQGSEWDNVLALEQISRTCDARRWRYTVATRAKERLVYCM